VGGQHRTWAGIRVEGENFKPCYRAGTARPSLPLGVAKLVERAGTAAGFTFKAHPHMLRQACGFALANAGHDTRALQAYLGHRNIQHTVRYTELAPDRFKDFWR
jgi:site-specific recombinase XerD